MTETVTAIYENGVLRPLRPLKLKERQRVQVRVIENPQDEELTEKERVLGILIAEGLIEPELDIPKEDPVSPERRAELAQLLSQAPGKTLSEIVIEDRGEW